MNDRNQTCLCCKDKKAQLVKVFCRHVLLRSCHSHFAKSKLTKQQAAVLIIGILKNVKEQLNGLPLPICAWCKSRMRDIRRNEWIQIGAYLQRYRQITHGICPACAKIELEKMKRAF